MKTTKRLLALLIALMLAVPIFALAEELTAEGIDGTDAPVSEESLTGDEEALDAGAEVPGEEIETVLGELAEGEELLPAAQQDDDVAEANDTATNPTTLSADRDDWTLASGTYTVAGTATVKNRIEVTGSATLVLGEGKILTAQGGIHVPPGKTLTIQGSGTLNATVTSDDRICLNAAAIGGDNNQAAGTINIKGGAITAVAKDGGTGAGIGGGNGGAGGTIAISAASASVSPTINAANGAGGGAGIGGGNGGEGGTISITGGTVTVETDNADTGAGIGGGEGKAGGTITIGGKAVISATTAGTGAGIGGGKSGAGGTITINDASVTSNNVTTYHPTVAVIDDDCLRQLFGEEEVVGGVHVHGYGINLRQITLRHILKEVLEVLLRAPLSRPDHFARVQVHDACGVGMPFVDGKLVHCQLCGFIFRLAQFLCTAFQRFPHHLFMDSMDGIPMNPNESP